MDMEGEIQRIGSLNRSLSRSLSRQPSIVTKIKDAAFSSSMRSSAASMRSSYEAQNDEEALMWAALERLPTYARVRTGILNMSEGQQKEVDIKHLGIIEKKALLDRLLKNAEEENERFLMKLRRRIDRAGIEMPTVEVRYEKFKIDAEIYVGTRGLPTLSNTFFNYFVPIGNALNLVPNNKKELTILHGISGIVKPRRMTLLLGPPGAGKTTLLKALAGKSDKDLKIQGNITYNGHQMIEFVPQRTTSYISQHDTHLGEMTVRETLAFSARCQGAGTRYEILSELSRKEKEARIHPDPDIDVFMKAIGTEGKEANIITDYVLKLLGLENCADTIVGNQLIRGVSGGEKKRVTTGEMVVGSANVFLMDEISTGLDSSTTFKIVNCIRQYNHIFGTTTVISLLQPSPETYELFDDIILLSEGQIVYQGPREYVLEFFESTGFKCPVRKGVADFLQEVTSLKDQQQYWMRDTPYRFVPVNAFAEAFRSFHVGRALEQELAVPFDRSKSHRAALTTKKYGVSNKELFKACFDRQLLLMKRNMPIYIFKAVELGFLTLVTMTVFFRTKLHHRDLTDGAIYMGALFLAITTIMFNGLAELGMTIFNLPVFYKQRGNRFYPPWAYSLPAWFLQIPISILDAAVWVFLSYYVIGFDPNIFRMLKQFLLLIGVNQMASGLFRLVAGIGRDLTIATTYGACAIILFVVLGGFIISRKDIKGWWIWGYWISPLAYAQNALSVNEFLGHNWNKVVPGTNQFLGHIVLKARGVFVKSDWFWLGFGALIGFTVLYNFLFTLTLTYLDAYGSEQPTISEETLRDKHIYLTGEGLEANQRENNVQRNGSARNNVQRNGSQRERGMVLPFTPLCMTFEDIKYSVDMPPAMKAQGETADRLMLLKGVSGSFRPGVLTALMGVTGAGKTTLMDVLAGRKTGGYIDGSIKISGYPKNQETFARVSAYCEQVDIHSPFVTVHESLIFSAWLRLPSEVDPDTRKMFIEEVMELVELTSLRGSIVGTAGVNGLSTEQRKRLTIAVELVANPSIIFMDEPTSGLDARAAAIVMRTVRNTVNTGRTVVCTIHQPSIDIFESFDELFLLRKGGQEIYFGPLGHNSCQLVEYLEGIRGVKKIKDGYNPATWMMEITAKSQEELLRVDFNEIYLKSELYQKNLAVIKELSVPPPGSMDLHFPTQYSQPFLQQCMACLWKQNLSYWRNPSYNIIRFVFTFIIALFFGTVFWRKGQKWGRVQDLFNAMGSMYASCVFLGVKNSSSIQPVVDFERAVYYRERAAGMYSALPYALGFVGIEIPYNFIQSVMYGITVYILCDYKWTAYKFIWFWFVMFFTFLYHTLYGMMSVAMSPNFHIAAVVASGFYSLWNIFSGFVIPRPRIPIWWRWFYWTCPIAWTLYGLLESQYGDIEDMLDNGMTVKQFLRSYYGFKRSFMPVVGVVIVSFTVSFALLFGYALKKLNWQKR
ncbi:ABC transporter G family member 36 [Rhynchospora pubera]|uniref:ABC transporter G family member 36 n=2 Tax=Rhynchospora pubera TaxID=906938 RepID=A0AAV8CMJ2_9POAL|nr:ABC transporter G family member 36 [Rhynchospora pubera]